MTTTKIINVTELRSVLFKVYNQEMTVSELREILFKAEKENYTPNEFEVLTQISE